MINPITNVAIILCGGEANRLGAIGKTCPKCLLKINGRSILEHHIMTFIDMGVKNIYLAVGYLSNKIEKLTSTFSYKVNIIPIESIGLGTGGSIKKVVNILPKDQNFFWVSMGDIFCYPNLKAMQSSLLKNNSQGVILGTKVYNPEEYGIIISDSKGRVIDFREKEKIQGSALIDAGFYLFNRKVFELDNLSSAFSLEYDLLPKLNNLVVFKHKSDWADVGTIHRLINARKIFKERTR